MSYRSEQTRLRKEFHLPYRCECGGIMEYAFDFGRIFSVCRKCTPTVVVNVAKLEGVR